jgi:peptidoglycan/LPS O-acetylase OafA/YrhL
VYPIYWIVLAFLIPAYFIFPSLGSGGETMPLQFFKSIFLLPYPADPVLAVAWTLRHEILFYAIFATIIANRTFGTWLIITWQIACVLALFFPAAGFPVNLLVSPHNVLFLFGMIVAWISQQQVKLPMPGAILLLGVVIFLATGFHEIYAERKLGSASYILLFGLGSALAVFGSVALEQAGRFRTNPLLQSLGDASYVAYLVHFPALSAGVKVMLALGIQDYIPEVLLFCLLFCGVTLLSYLIHRYIERPLLSRFSKPRSTASATA